MTPSTEPRAVAAHPRAFVGRATNVAVDQYAQPPQDAKRFKSLKESAAAIQTLGQSSDPCASKHSRNQSRKETLHMESGISNERRFLFSPKRMLGE